jgi:hypothetical protein
VKAPKVIWLQHCYGDLDTWCKDKIGDDDIPYVRHDLFNQVYQELIRCRQGMINLAEFDIIPDRYVPGSEEIVNRIDALMHRLEGVKRMIKDG